MSATPCRCCFVEPESPEWIFAWRQIERRYGETAQLHQNEVWQYMGTEFTSYGWMHTFRHRCHPSDGLRRYDRFPTHPAWEPPQEEQKAIPETIPAPRQSDPWETDFGGAFDGIQVTSDADPGL